MGGRNRARDRANNFLHPAHYGQQRNGEVYFRCDSHGGNSKLLPNHLARSVLCDTDLALAISLGPRPRMHGLADTVPSRTERIRATSGTTSAGLAIGITNVSERVWQGLDAEEALTDSIVTLQGVTQLMGIVVSIAASQRATARQSKS